MQFKKLMILIGIVCLLFVNTACHWEAVPEWTKFEVNGLEGGLEQYNESAEYDCIRVDSLLIWPFIRVLHDNEYYTCIWFFSDQDVGTVSVEHVSISRQGHPIAELEPEEAITLEKAENGYKGVISVGDFGMDTFDLVNEEQWEYNAEITVSKDGVTTQINMPFTMTVKLYGELYSGIMWLDNLFYGIMSV